MSGLMDKVCARADLPQRLAALPRPWVFTNGVFDVLHKGHVSYLHQARALGASLIVAVNSDASARGLGKGPDRPLNRAQDRAAVLAGLASVSLVTFFDESTPVSLIREIRPDLYVKGGDYDMETLEETRVVRSWGGQSLAIPFVDGYSTTALVDRIRGSEAPRALRRAAFLDRDGVINRDRAYVGRWEDFEFVPGAIDAMRRLQQAGYQLVVITNQSGLARGYYTEAQYHSLTAQMRTVLGQAGVDLAGIYHCPHHPEGQVAEWRRDCDCRKPAPGMILRAASELGLSLPDSLLVGDKPSDIQAARTAGVGRAYLVRSDNKESTLDPAGADALFPDLAHCVDAVLAHSGKSCPASAS
jgi:rfaE bifunctional protein nucleotidyltransferase chain/domain